MTGSLGLRKADGSAKIKKVTGCCGAADSTLFQKFMAEFVGTYLLVFYGVGINAVAIGTSATSGIWQGASVWGFGAAIAVYSSAGVSGGHLNPAVSFAHILCRRDEFPLRLFLPYCAAQFLGAILAAAVILACFGPSLELRDKEEGFSRGEAGSELTAAGFGEYFPDPAYDVAHGGRLTHDSITTAGCFFMQTYATALMLFFVQSMTDERNPARPTPGMAPFMIGMGIAVLIAIFAPYNQAGMNPARDFGPRLVSLMAGYKSIAIPGPRDGFWIYLVSPMVGAPLGIWWYDLTIRPGLPPAHDEEMPPAVRERAPSGLWAADQQQLHSIIRELKAVDIDQVRKSVRGQSQGGGSILAGSVTAQDSMA